MRVPLFQHNGYSPSCRVARRMALESQNSSCCQCAIGREKACAIRTGEALRIPHNPGANGKYCRRSQIWAVYSRGCLCKRSPTPDPLDARLSVVVPNEPIALLNSRTPVRHLGPLNENDSSRTLIKELLRTKCMTAANAVTSPYSNPIFTCQQSRPRLLESQGMMPRYLEIRR